MKFIKRNKSIKSFLKLRYGIALKEKASALTQGGRGPLVEARTARPEPYYR